MPILQVEKIKPNHNTLWLHHQALTLELVNECVDLMNSSLPRLADVYENDNDQVWFVA